MMMLLLLSLAALGSAQTPSPFTECITGEFLADGYTTGQNIELNYQGTQMGLDANGDTQITVGFLVPKVYSESYMASAFTVSFNRDIPQLTATASPATAMKVTSAGQATANDAACFTNQIANSTECQRADNPTVWSNAGAQGDSPCVDYMYMTISWTEAITNQAFGNVQFIDNGASTDVYMMATVETWRKFDQTTGSNYLGQMTGSQQLNTGGSSTSGQGSYWGDGGDLNVAFPALMLNDWRYTLYQIPFYMKFPKTVVVSNAFTIGSPIAVLNGVVSQDVIQINLNPTSGVGGVQFAVLDASITTEVQYPYAIRGPSDSLAPMLAYIGSNANGGGTHAASISFVKWDDPKTCGGNVPGQICQQTFTVRISPTTTAPCSVAGDYYLEFWAECVDTSNGCGIGTNVQQTGNLATQRNSQAYFNLKFTVAHQDFCPEVVDTVHVAVDLQAYHDEAFSVPISNNYNGNPTAYSSNTNVVYTNDIIYYEATYRTGSQKSDFTGSHANQVVGTNNAGTPGTDGIIDYVRAVKIFTDVYLGLSAPGVTTGTWNTGGWKTNLSWQLGGSRVPGPGEDFDDAATTVTGARVVEVPTSQPADSATWRMIECEVAYIDPAVPIMTGVKPADCFTATTAIATDFMDFEKVDSSLAGSANSIDENEVAFKMRLDERVYPIGPDTDNSYITVTLESEVYYIGNLHPTRRLLQVGVAPPARKQKHVKSMQHSVHYKPSTLQTCQLDTKLTTTSMAMTLDFSGAAASVPTLATVNNWALNLGAELEKHMDIQDSMTVTEVEACSATGCNLLLDTAVAVAGRRRAQGSDLVHVTVDVVGTDFSTAGMLVNLLQVEIATRKFTVTDAQITHMDMPDCNTVATTTKLASSSAALALLFPALATLLALL